MTKNFEVSAYCGSRYECNNANMISRILNSITNAINKNKLLPKYILVVLDNDLIQFLGYDKFGMVTMLGTWLEHLIESLINMCQEHKGMLPTKAIKHSYPMIYWMSCPHHKLFVNNGAQSKYNSCLEASMKGRSNIRMIKFKQIWDYENGHLVFDGTGALTSYGISKYWRSVDAAFHYNIKCHELFILKERKAELQAEIDQENPKPAKQPTFDRMKHFFKKHKGQDPFHWTRKDGKRRKLPTPNKPC